MGRDCTVSTMSTRNKRTPEQHKAKNLASREKRRVAREAGICYRCFKRPVERGGGHTTCLLCRAQLTYKTRQPAEAWCSECQASGFHRFYCVTWETVLHRKQPRGPAPPSDDQGSATQPVREAHPSTVEDGKSRDEGLLESDLDEIECPVPPG